MFVCGAELSGRSVARCRSMKCAYRSAVENAFSHLLLVMLDNDKLFVDVNVAMATDSAAGLDSQSALLMV